ncbi:MAG: hypothetical protein RLZZ501_2795 [Pseudomonadota bacterium]|jgi:pyruvate dehydrogenase E1 component alpha subunit
MAEPFRVPAPATAVPSLPAETLLDLYRAMLRLRRFEEKAGQLYGMGLIAGFCHLYIGQEAVVAGIEAVAAPADSCITSYRDHAHLLARGVDPGAVMAELLGRASGLSHGKGGSMHLFSREKGFYGGHGIVGAQVPLGVGLAFAHHYREDGGVAHVYLGDGAVNQGQVYEAFNMAALWRLPVLFVIENNRYAMGTSSARHAAGEELSGRGAGYGIPGTRVDGMNVLAVRSAAARALSHARGGAGPFILETMTYRYRGHSMSDPAKYRSKEEVTEMREHHDPIARLARTMLDHGLVEQGRLDEIDRAIRAEIAAAADFAQSSPEPDPAALTRDVVREA